MKKITFLVVLGMILTVCTSLLALPAPVAAAVTIPAGDVSGTWTAANSPYLIGGDIVVPAGQTLSIEPGVEVIWQGWYKVSVYGTLSAEGTAGAPILFGGGDPSAGWGGVRMYAGSDASRLTYVTIEKARATGANSERLGGGLYIENASPTISHSTIRDNFATLGGGGIALVNSNALIADSLVVDNSASLSASANGGGIYMSNSSPTLLRNIIRGNWLYIAGSFSTPTGLGGGIYSSRSSPVLRYNVIADNRVDAHSNSVARGGGLYFYGGNPDLVNNTIVGNWTPDQYSPTWEREGGGIYVTTAHLTIVNSVFWDNSPQQLYVDEYTVLTVAYTDVQGGQAGVVTEGNPTINNAGGNIAADPRFVDAANGDYHLEANSPAVDAGTAYFEWEGRVLVDLAPGDYLGTAPDMGALENGEGGTPNQPPVAVASADPDHGSAPLTVQFSADGSSDPDGSIVAYAWDFGDGSTSTEADPAHTYTAVGTFQATLTVTDDDGATHSDVVPINVVDGTTIWSGDVSGTWALSGSPYRIEGDIVVAAGQTLSIEPGVEVIWQGWYKVSVYGTLSAEGTAGAPILFGGGHPTAGWGGIRMYAGSDASRLSYVTIEKARATGANSERLGGGLYIENASPTISHSTIRDNFATLGGGGIALVNSNALIEDSLVVDNSASLSASANGGGIYMSNSSPTLLRNTIRGNWLYIAGSFSTPTGLGGGIYSSRSSPVLRYNVIADNRVDAHANSVARGGGLYFYGGNPDLVNNTIVGNWTPDQYSPTWEREGGGLYVTTAHLTIVNSVFWDNSPQQLYVDEYTVLTVAYTDVEGGQAGVVTEGNPTINDAEGNIAADPRFVDAANGDYHLEANSPAVDAGTAYFEWEGRVLVDLAPGDYLGAAPDMGAYDVAGSGQVNQPPVAVASADPDHGSAPLTVQFSADGSSDPDGSIVAYAWDFGDGSTSSEADPAHTYMAVGTFQAMLTVTDDDGATGTDAVAVSVSQVSQNELHVKNQTVSRQTFLRYARGLDEVLVTDQNNQPVAGAVVTAVYSGPNKGTVTGMTGSDGTVLLATKIKRNPSGVWCFEVTDVAKDGYLYNPAANVVTIQCERQ